MLEQQRRRLSTGRQDPLAGGPAAGKGGADTLSSLLLAKNLKVTCVYSVTDADLKKRRSFGEKDRIGMDGEKVCSSDGPMPKLAGVEYTCKKGLKPESPNQDSYVIVTSPGEWGLYGVFDGHGPNGHDVSDFAVRTLVMMFLESSFLTSTEECFKNAFTSCQEAIQEAKKTGLDSSSSGSTCTMAFHNLETDVLTLAHVGDSRGVVYEGSEAPLKVLKETEDHKPNLPGEKARIEKMGGRVVFDGYYNYRVFAKAGMYPGLNMSRALGDVVAHQEAGLTAEPELNVVSLKEMRGAEGKKLMLIIASDGVWEFIQSNEAPDHLGPKSRETVADGSTSVVNSVEPLAKKSWDSWMLDSDNEISDDITVMTIEL